jgi:hypothetical protein
MLFQWVTRDALNTKCRSARWAVRCGSHGSDARQQARPCLSDALSSGSGLVYDRCTDGWFRVAFWYA